MLKITYKHWKKDKTLEVIGTLPSALNNGSSERLVVKLSNGLYEDVLKNTIITIEEVDNDNI